MGIPTAPVVAISTLSFLILLAIQTADLSGSQQGRTTWRYAYVLATHGGAEVCYIEAEGCRLEKVSVEPIYTEGRNRNIIDASATSRRATLTAIHALGASGWEMVLQGFLYAGDGDEAIYFKRAE